MQGSGPQFASVVHGVPLYEQHPIPGITKPGTIQWLNPNAFVSTVDPEMELDGKKIAQYRATTKIYFDIEH